jgi:hypothetical protein
MKKHTALYFDFFGYDTESFIPCEVCGAKAVDIHHIQRRGMGGSKTQDYIGNLMAVCRLCHDRYGDRTKYKDFLREIHEEKINLHNVKTSAKHRNG